MQILINGMIDGLLIAIMGVAVSLIYSTTKILNIALGAFYVLAPYIVLAVLQQSLPWGLAILVAFISVSLLSLMSEKVIHWPLETSHSPGDIHLIASLGLLIVITQVTAIIWGNETQILRSELGTLYQLFNIRLTQAQVLSLISSISILALFFSWLKLSKMGLQLRALADNPLLLSIMGKNVRKLRYSIFLTGAILSASVAIVTAYDIGFDPYSGLHAVLLGIIAAIIGGKNSFIGAALAGLLLGIIQSQILWFGSAQWEDAVSFIVLALFLLFRPNGIFNREKRVEFN